MQQPKDILTQWMEAVNQKDLDHLLALYDPQAMLIPTFSNQLLNTPEKRRAYFEKLYSREGLYVSLHEKSLAIQPVHHHIFILNGLYTWQFILDEELLHFEARFNYVIDLATPSPIIQHHSSQIPRML